jgi:hypothetical protein
MKTFEIGDKVAYSVQFLKSTGQTTGNVPFARGIIKSFKRMGGIHSFCIIEWNDPDIPTLVNPFNLAIVGSNRRFCNID